MIHYNKLIRDNIPEIKQREGRKLVYHTADDDREYWHKLLDKLQSEINKLGKRADIEVFADILEVLDAIREFKEMDFQEVQIFKQQKRHEKGGYTKRYVLESSEEEIGHRQEQTI